VPGHAVAGVVGTIALVSAVILAFGFAFLFVAAQAISIALVLSALAFVVSTRVFPERESAFMRRITFSAAQGPEYVASLDHRQLVGRTGYAARSCARPASQASRGIASTSSPEATSCPPARRSR
jgi:membrane-bound ClpP family serine protease